MIRNVKSRNSWTRLSVTDVLKWTSKEQSTFASLMIYSYQKIECGAEVVRPVSQILVLQTVAQYAIAIISEAVCDHVEQQLYI